MPYIAAGNILYLLFAALCILISVFFLLLNKKLGKDFALNFLKWMLWANFALHFLKQVTPFYLFREGVSSLRHSLPENLCAILIMASPFIFMSKNKYLMDYLVVVGFISALAAILVPTTPRTLSTFEENGMLALNTVAGVSELIRFYLCHIPLLLAPVLILYFGFHKLSYRRIPVMPLILMSAFAIVTIENLVVAEIGWYPTKINHAWEAFDRDFEGNPAMALGPSRAYDKASWTYYLITPLFQYKLPNGEMAFIPALWATFPLYLIAVPVVFLLYLPFQYKQIKADLAFLKERRKKNDQGKSE